MKSIVTYLDIVTTAIRTNYQHQFLEQINKPLGLNPTDLLKTLHIPDPNTSNEGELNEMVIVSAPKPVMSIELFLEIEQLLQDVNDPRAPRYFLIATA
jgi:hypothetical protein